MWMMYSFLFMVYVFAGMSFAGLASDVRQRADIIPTSHKVQKSKPVVCYEHNRNAMRQRLVEWMSVMEGFLKDRHHKDQVKHEFYQNIDANKNGKLDHNEFRILIGYNETVAKVPGEDEFINPILQSLCSNALLALVDLNTDKELSWEEFIHCIDPHFKPPHQLCELDGNMYKDGTEIPTKCNSCVCACGTWVCTVFGCNEKASRVHEPEASDLVVDGKEAKNKLKKEVVKLGVREKHGNGEELVSKM